jgi:glycosyltransferase involved in cell wall biosynthesis
VIGVAGARVAVHAIGVVTTSYPRSPDDSAGGFVRERVRALVAEGHTVEIVAAACAQPTLRGLAGCGASREGRGPLGGPDEHAVTRLPAGSLFYDGGAPEALEQEGLLPRLAAWATAFGFSCALFGEIARRARGWDRVESHWLLPCGLVAAAALPGVPHRAHAHGGDVYLFERLPWGHAWARALCRSRPELVFASASLRERFSALAGAAPESLGARCLVEPAPFDQTFFFPRTENERHLARVALGFDCVRSRGGLPPSPSHLERRTLLAAGRLVPIKGFDTLVAAVARMPVEARPSLLIAGEGPERARLARQAREAGVVLELPGLLGQRALAQYMAAADLFVHPCRTLAGGRSEGMPLVVREALARGLPVIASASGGLAELRGATGLTLVPEDDVEALAEAIRQAFG